MGEAHRQSNCADAEATVDQNDSRTGQGHTACNPRGRLFRVFIRQPGLSRHCVLRSIRNWNILEAALENACRLLNFGGRICVIAFHSLEDRIVKQTFRRLNSQAGGFDSDRDL